MKGITVKQREILDMIQAGIDKNGYPPTIKEMADALGLGKEAVHARCILLRNKGALEWEEAKARTFRVTV